MRLTRVYARFWLFDLTRPDPPTLADKERQADHERLTTSLEFRIELSALSMVAG